MSTQKLSKQKASIRYFLSSCILVVDVVGCVKIENVKQKFVWLNYTPFVKCFISNKMLIVITHIGMQLQCITKEIK